MATMLDIERIAAELESARGRLAAAIAESPELFTKRRSVVLHGVKAGFQQRLRDLSWEDDAALVAAIRENIPEQFSQLVEVTETPNKDALAEIDPATLGLIGIKVKPAGARVTVKFVDPSDDRQLALPLGTAAAS